MRGLDHEQRVAHLALLRRVLELRLRESTREKFADMLEEMTTEVFRPCAHGPPRWRQWALTRGQELFALRVLGEEPAPETRLTDGGIPRGRKVEMAPVLRKPLPMRPPGR